MITNITRANWSRTREHLSARAELFAELAGSADAGGRATAHWSAADTAAHVATLTRVCAALVDPERDPGPLGDIGDHIRRTRVDTVDALNDTLMERFAEREPRVLGRAVRDDVAHILRATARTDPAGAVPWLGGSEVPLAGVLAHLLNELQIHGRDIARPARLPWRVPAGEAAPFFEHFLVGVTEYGYGRLLDGHGPAPKGRVAVEFRSEHTTPVTMAMTDGFVTVEKPDGHPDVRLSFDPPSLNLMLFGRISKARAVLTRRVVIGGRRPWLLPGFLRIVRLPS